ncbi:MAG: GNAT family N-acetyltransferase [Chlamydiales bacterium]|nr:GNAT family N-acetyltransferase [Chlamydiales bacterium]
MTLVNTYIPWTIPVRYPANMPNQTLAEKVLELSDDLIAFCLCIDSVASLNRDSSMVAPGNFVDITTRAPPLLLETVIKVLACVTIILPILALIAKTVLRLQYTFVNQVWIERTNVGFTAGLATAIPPAQVLKVEKPTPPIVARAPEKRVIIDRSFNWRNLESVKNLDLRAPHVVTISEKQGRGSVFVNRTYTIYLETVFDKVVRRIILAKETGKKEEAGESYESLGLLDDADDVDRLYGDGAVQDDLPDIVYEKAFKIASKELLETVCRILKKEKCINGYAKVVGDKHDQQPEYPGYTVFLIKNGESSVKESKQDQPVELTQPSSVEPSEKAASKPKVLGAAGVKLLDAIELGTSESLQEAFKGLKSACQHSALTSYQRDYNNYVMEIFPYRSSKSYHSQSNQIKSENLQVVFADVAGKKVGVIVTQTYSASPDMRTQEAAHITYVLVNPDYRRSGIGTRLVEEAMRRAQGVGKQYLYIKSSPHEQFLWSFTQKIGSKGSQLECVDHRDVGCSSYKEMFYLKSDFSEWHSLL